MVTKVVTDQDVDNVTIIINPQNKLEAKIPTSTPSEVEIEEMNAVLSFTFDQGIVVYRKDTKTNHPITQLGRVKGTDWLVIKADSMFNTTTNEPMKNPNWDYDFNGGEAYRPHNGVIEVSSTPSITFKGDFTNVKSFQYTVYNELGLRTHTKENTGVSPVTFEIDLNDHDNSGSNGHFSYGVKDVKVIMLDGTSYKSTKPIRADSYMIKPIERD